LATGSDARRQDRKYPRQTCRRAILAVPGLFDLLAFGRLARSGYARIVLGAVIVGFVLIKFLLIEVPIVGYTISFTYTSVQVNRFSGWMQANKLQISPRSWA
jgi:hypothetical protein